MTEPKEQSGFYILLRAHDHVWHTPQMDLKERIQVCTLLWTLAIKIEEEKINGNSLPQR